MHRLYVALLLVLAASSASAQVDLKFPSQPQSKVEMPGPMALFGARLYAPAGQGPHPALVLSHTCAPLRQHVLEWAARAVAAGYVALVVDHLGPRSLTNNCYPDFRVTVTQYAQDDIAGLRHLRTLPFVDRGRIGQVGFSYGAMAGLRSASASFRQKNLGSDRFTAIVAMYPWCNERRGAGGDHQYNFYDDTDVPLFLVLGADDDEASPASCVDQAKKNAAKGLPVSWKVYPKTTHGFDSSLMGDKPFVIRQGTSTVTYRYNAATVAEAWADSLAFFGRNGLGR